MDLELKWYKKHRATEQKPKAQPEIASLGGDLSPAKSQTPLVEPRDHLLSDSIVANKAIRQLNV